MNRTRYLSGTIEIPNQRIDLIVDDGRLTHGFIIRSIQFWPVNSFTVGDFSCTISTKTSGAVVDMLASDNRQIAWAWFAGETTGAGPPQYIIKPNEMIIEELILVAKWTYPGLMPDGLNYLIELEPLTVTDSQAALVLISNKSQDITNP